MPLLYGIANLLVTSFSQLHYRVAYHQCLSLNCVPISEYSLVLLCFVVVMIADLSDVKYKWRHSLRSLLHCSSCPVFCCIITDLSDVEYKWRHSLRSLLHCRSCLAWKFWGILFILQVFIYQSNWKRGNGNGNRKECLKWKSTFLQD